MFRVVIVAPSNNPHVAAFSEVAIALTTSIRELGYECDLKLNEVSSDSINIILGFHLLSPNDIPQGCKYIVYQLEQLSDTEGWFPTHPNMLPLLKNAIAVWDFTNENVDFLKSKGVLASYIPVGFADSLVNINHQQNRDIDILFYGSRNERRSKILEELHNNGVVVKALFGIYGEERDKWISRSKIIINIHYYEKSLFESVRLSYLVNNRVAVISEESSSYPWSSVPLIQASYNDIVTTTITNLNDINQLENYRNTCFERFKSEYKFSDLINPLIKSII
jgi:hypothetical protein